MIASHSPTERRQDVDAASDPMLQDVRQQPLQVPRQPSSRDARALTGMSRWSREMNAFSIPTYTRDLRRTFELRKK